MDPVTISTALRYLSAGVSIAQAAHQGIQTALDTRSIIQAMAASGSDPTEAEWQKLDETINQLVTEIIAA